MRSDQVILDADEQGCVITILASSQSVDVLMERITVRRGHLENSGGIYINTKGNVSLEELRILDNTGSGVYVEGVAELTVANSSFLNNYGGYHHGGGGLYASGATSVTLNRNTFSNNSTDPDGKYSLFGGAVYLSGIDSVILDKNIFSDNYAKNDGGAVYMATDHSSSVTLVHNIILNNSTGAWGGGVLIYSKYGNTDTITQHIEFNDRSLNLVISNGRVMLGDQSVGTASAAIE